MTNTKTEHHFDSPVQIAKDARRTIRKTFPGLKFSLTGSSGTGYGWLNLSWTDGPKTRDMDAAIAEYRTRTRDRILTQRDYTPEAIDWATQQVAQKPHEWASAYDHDGGSPYYAVRNCLADTTL